MSKIDFDELQKLSDRMTEKRRKVMSKLDTYQNKIIQFEEDDAENDPTALLGQAWDSARAYFSTYQTVAKAINNIVFIMQESLDDYLDSFISEVGEAENRLDTDDMADLLRKMQEIDMFKASIIEGIAKVFHGTPLGKWADENSVLQVQQKFKLLAKYKTFEASHAGDFGEYKTLIAYIEEGLAYLGDSKNFDSSNANFKKAGAKATWLLNLEAYNDYYDEDKVEYEEENYGLYTFTRVYTNGKYDAAATKKLNEETIQKWLKDYVNNMPERERQKLLSDLGVDDVQTLLDPKAPWYDKLLAMFFLIPFGKRGKAGKRSTKYALKRSKSAIKRSKGMIKSRKHVGGKKASGVDDVETPKTKPKVKPKLNDLTPEEISRMSLDELRNSLPDGWEIFENNGRVHIKDAAGNFRVRIDPPDKVTNHEHMHIFDEKGNPLDKNGNIVDKKSPDAHIPWTDK